MNKKTTKSDKIVVGVCIGLLISLTFTITLRSFTLNILMEYLGIDNTFTRFVWFDNDNVASILQNEGDANASSEVTISWAEMYPFDDSRSDLDIAEIEASSDKKTTIAMCKGLDYITSTVEDVEDKLESYTTELLVFQSSIVEWANSYEDFMGWNISSFEEYNSVVELSDGYLTSYVSKQDISHQYEALVELNAFCQDECIDFLYIQAPYKISEYDDTDVSGIVDFSNQNADELLAQLDDAGIDYYDIRENIHENNLSNHDLFYKTDHHWKTTTGLWAAQNILAYCNEKYGWNTNLSLLNDDKFDYVTYKNWFLGSKGKKVTLSRCQPDDFTLLYPKYNTSFHYYVPAEGIDTIGDYSVVYDMSQIDECDFYNKNPYSGCNYGDQPLIQIENQLTADEHKILIISDSFGDCMISCLALVEKNVDSIDLRYFNGSLKAYIEDSQPDIVMIMYNPQAIAGNIDYSTHKDLFDFR